MPLLKNVPKHWHVIHAEAITVVIEIASDKFCSAFCEENERLFDITKR